MSLSLDIVTPDGVAFSYTNLDRAVLRQVGARSKENVLVLKSPLERLVAPLPAQIMRARAGGNVIHIEIDGGFVEAQDDGVTVLTEGARVIAVDQLLVTAAS